MVLITISYQSQGAFMIYLKDLKRTKNTAKTWNELDSFIRDLKANNC